MKHWLFQEEHEALRQAVRRFVQKEIVPNTEKWEEAQEIPRSLFRRCGELGFFGLKFPEEYGGQGGDYLAAAVFKEEVARSGCLGVLAALGVHSGVVLPPLYKFGTEEQRRRYLVPGIAGEKVGALAVTEPNAGSDVASLQTTARREGDFYVLNGSKIFITNGVNADFVIVAAKTRPEAGHRGISLFIVDRRTPGFEVGQKLQKAGLHSSDTGYLIFDNCRVPAANLLGEENRGFYMLMEGFQWERLLLALGAVGMAEAALAHALTYARQRVQFGQPIGRFQAVGHRLAEMATRLEMIRNLTYHALWLFHTGQPCLKEVSMAKLAATEIAHQIAGEALQLHGGYGYMREYPIERIWRDTRVATIVAGTSEIMREIIAREMKV
ncbi:acyl-CoA dehydrogenase family protein [Desulfovirgula thermocuniculi]|uniref:acyl-CoA dehydrogenase family protein n=1 Tax=Desulfovirgula thermocuniculi TaxID=348842 RepID=UPI000412C30B|nr:acyl-CoA dehydrogenase family protein [Desulfovirgula thermocuniculi]